jgi:fibrillarin-like rRNA methylase
VCVDLATRCLRDLTHLAKDRPGLIPILGDARKFTAWGVLIPKKVRWLFQDVSQAGQVEIFIKAANRFLADDGIGLLSLKAASERWTGEEEAQVFTNVEIALEQAGLIVEESIDLAGFEDNHMLFAVRKSRNN